MHFTARVGAMSAMANRKRRATNAPTVLLQGRVSPQAKDEVHLAAAASGVTLAYYLDTLIADLVAEHGTLPLVAKPGVKNTQQELPITDAA